MDRPIALTGDRPTGALHVGHYVGSILTRKELQDTHHSLIMIADTQALTDNAKTPQKVSSNVLEVLRDYLACGLDPDKTTFLLQSQVKALFELSTYFLNLVSWNRVVHNPTVKTEIKQKNFGEGVPTGFVLYPIYQAADILLFNTDTVAVGIDQKPMLEQTVVLARRFNDIYGKVFKEPKLLLSSFPRVLGIYGKAKMGKNLNNAIFLKDSAEVLHKKIKKMYTDPNHIRIEDKGQVEGNMVFHYLDIFGSKKEEVEELKKHYTKGGLADSKVKEYLYQELNKELSPIREKRSIWENRDDDLWDILKTGTKVANSIAEHTMQRVAAAMHMNYPF